MRNTSGLLDDEVDEDCELEDKKERGSIEFLNVEGDGILDNIFEVLWTQQDTSSRLAVVIPDTVVFKFNKPTSWYFTKISSKGRAPRFHKKKASSLRIGLILKHFEKACSICCSDIVAYYISQTETTSEGTRASHIHYLTREELPHFLLHTRNKNGILQGFVDPKPSTSSTYNNCLVRCTWSQSVCLVERRTNVHLLTSGKVSRYDKAETFEGDFRNSNEYPLTSAKLLEQIQAVCSKIVSHFFDIACGKVAITNMVVNFKFDAETRLHFLWCESVRLTVKKHPATGLPLAPKPVQIGGAQDFNLANKLKLPSKSQQGQEFKICAFCNKDYATTDLVKTAYHTLLCSYDEIQLTGTRKSEPLRRMKERWYKLSEKPVKQTNDTDKETAVPVDAQSFTQPMNTERGLLAHIDERVLLTGPMQALSKAIEEWDERQARNEKKEETLPNISSRGRSCADMPGIPWFIRKLHPYISVKDWLYVRNRDDFLNLTVSLCGFCFLGLSRGLCSQDTLRRHHNNLSKKPKLQDINEIPSMTNSRRRTVGADDRRKRRQGPSKLLVPCEVSYTAGEEEQQEDEALMGSTSMSASSPLSETKDTPMSGRKVVFLRDTESNPDEVSDIDPPENRSQRRSIDSCSQAQSMRSKVTSCSSMTSTSSGPIKVKPVMSQCRTDAAHLDPVYARSRLLRMAARNRRALQFQTLLSSKQDVQQQPTYIDT
eukprot:TRINITY_DN12190_c0_g1_i1.p1 TRINITY_DN12190_c0_g1~~TRINITY_DN12190_c0_g1_i1.p1  ORF type:complete len:713 (+),score=169.39 TRINITY_DN12190_c0_g1_i1:1095-3233(+)